MACCGGGSIKRGAGRRAASALVAGTERVLVEYLGTRVELWSVRGRATGTKYFFAQRETERIQLVYVEDVEGLECRRDFSLLGEMA